MRSRQLSFSLQPSRINLGSTWRGRGSARRRASRTRVPSAGRDANTLAMLVDRRDRLCNGRRNLGFRAKRAPRVAGVANRRGARRCGRVPSHPAS